MIIIRYTVNKDHKVLGVKHKPLQMRKPLPSKVRIWKKSLDNSKQKLAIGKFNPSGTGSKAYHEKNVARLEKLMLQYGYLLDMYRMPTKEEKYY